VAGVDEYSKHDVVVLMSGGHDSSNLIRKFSPKYALFVDYGQPCAAEELAASVEICRRFGVKLHTRTIPPLTQDGDEGCPFYYGRNLILIGLAVALAQEVGANDVLIGCTAEDDELFPDCRDVFLDFLDNGCQLAYRVGVKAPLTTRPSYIVEGTWSCYEPRLGKPCGKCYGCKKGQQA
jgi:7-cyano-7-deazaguanine synthase